MTTLTPDQIATIRFHLAKGVKRGTVAGWFGVRVHEMMAALEPQETAPSGAPAAGDEEPHQQHSAGTAAAYRGARGQPLNGADDALPLREVVEGAPTPDAVNDMSQSARPTHFEARPPIPLPAPQPPSARPLPTARPGSARELAALAEKALAGGATVTRCPTAIAAPTEGARVDPVDAETLRRHLERQTETNGFAWKRTQKGNAA